jgi:serine/threonine-protein kinase
MATGRPVALKVFHDALARDAGFAEAVAREVARLRPLAGETRLLVGVLDWLRLDDGRLALVTEYVAGPSLRAILQAEGALSLPRLLRVGQELAAALQALHERRIVHGDVRPEHVLLIGSGDEERVRLKGLEAQGLTATAIVDRLIRAGTLPGTPAYTPPERIAGGAVTERTDIYAYGTLLYEMLTGYAPFGGASAEEIVSRQLRQPPVPPRALRATVPPTLQRQVLQALEKEPARRQRYPADVLSDVVLAQAAQEYEAEAGESRRLRIADLLRSDRGWRPAIWLVPALLLVLVAIWGLWGEHARRAGAPVASPPPAAGTRAGDAGALADDVAGGAGARRAPAPDGVPPSAAPAEGPDQGQDRVQASRPPRAPAGTARRPAGPKARPPRASEPEERAPAAIEAEPPERRSAPDDGTAIIDWLLKQPR